MCKNLILTCTYWYRWPRYHWWHFFSFCGLIEFDPYQRHLKKVKSVKKILYIWHELYLNSPVHLNAFSSKTCHHRLGIGHNHHFCLYFGVGLEQFGFGLNSLTQVHHLMWLTSQYRLMIIKTNNLCLGLIWFSLGFDWFNRVMLGQH